MFYGGLWFRVVVFDVYVCCLVLLGWVLVFCLWWIDCLLLTVNCCLFYLIVVNLGVVCLLFVGWLWLFS